MLIFLLFSDQILRERATASRGGGAPPSVEESQIL